MSQYQLTSTTPKDKPQRTLERLQTSMSRESLTSLLLQPSLSDLTRLKERLSLSTILVVVPSISHCSKSQVVYSKSRQLTEILHSVEKILISVFKNSLSENSRNNTEWIFQRINSHYKESEKPQKRQRLNSHQPARLKSTFLISQLMPLDQSTCKSQSQELSTKLW